MNRIDKMIVAAMAAAFAATGSASAALYNDAPKVQARAEILWVRPICVETNRYIGWPSVCLLKSEDLMAVFSGDRDRHVCPFGKVQYVRSTDGGETWGAPVTIANGPIDDRDAGIVQMPDGEIVVTYFTSIAYRTYNKNFKVDYKPEDPRYWWKRHDEKISEEVRRNTLGNWRVSSRDNGLTWSKPEKMADVSQTPHGPILLRDGTLFQLGRSFEGSVQGSGERGRTIVSTWKSFDAGRTWKCMCPDIPDTNGENSIHHMFHEPHVVELADGTLLGLVRYHGKDGCMRQCESKDGGKTWSPMVKTPLLGLPPHLIQLKDGKVVCVYGRRRKDPGCGEFACISDDGGRTWDVANEISLAPHTDGDLGYPASTVLPNGDILTVYYQPMVPKGMPCLMATRWRVTR